MKRREVMTLLAAGAAPVFAGCASETAAPAMPTTAAVAAPVEPIEVQDYVVLEKAVPVGLGPGKAVEVIEFFWYECPHCNAFEPFLVPWIGRQKPDVQFRRVPVGFTPRHVATQKFFYALEALGQRERLHARIFDAIHRRSRGMVTEQEQRDFVSAEGVDGASFVQALRSPQVVAQVQAATALAEAYDVAGVPSLGIQGRFYTSAALTSTRQRLLAVADALIERCRQGR